jgi:enoyl-CoA hydratase/carnithine racemase
MSTDTGVVRLDRRDAVATITLDRPGARNALTWAMYEELDRALDRVGSEPDVRVVVVRGAGGNFAAGTDISQFAAFTSGDDGVEYERRLEAVLTKLESLPATSIAAVEGYAAGFGLALAAACDLRIASPNAQFGVPIARTIGNCLSMGNYARLVASLGAARTKAMLLTAEFMSANEARATGFEVRVLEHHAYARELDLLCARLVTHAPLTLQVTREAVRRIVSRSVADGDDLLRRVYGSGDFREGVAAFVEKRKPRWEGR